MGIGQAKPTVTSKILTIFLDKCSLDGYKHLVNFQSLGEDYFNNFYHFFYCFVGELTLRGPYSTLPKALAPFYTI